MIKNMKEPFEVGLINLYRAENYKIWCPTKKKEVHRKDKRHSYDFFNMFESVN